MVKRKRQSTNQAVKASPSNKKFPDVIEKDIDSGGMYCNALVLSQIAAHLPAVEVVRFTAVSRSFASAAKSAATNHQTRISLHLQFIRHPEKKARQHPCRNCRIIVLDKGRKQSDGSRKVSISVDASVRSNDGNLQVRLESLFLHFPSIRSLKIDEELGHSGRGRCGRTDEDKELLEMMHTWLTSAVENRPAIRIKSLALIYYKELYGIMLGDCLLKRCSSTIQKMKVQICAAAVPEETPKPRSKRLAEKAPKTTEIHNRFQPLAQEETIRLCFASMALAEQLKSLDLYIAPLDSPLMLIEFLQALPHLERLKLVVFCQQADLFFESLKNCHSLRRVVLPKIDSFDFVADRSAAAIIARLRSITFGNIDCGVHYFRMYAPPIEQRIETVLRALPKDGVLRISFDPLNMDYGDMTEAKETLKWLIKLADATDRQIEMALFEICKRLVIAGDNPIQPPNRQRLAELISSLKLDDGYSTATLSFPSEKKAVLCHKRAKITFKFVPQDVEDDEE